MQEEPGTNTPEAKTPFDIDIALSKAKPSDRQIDINHIAFDCYRLLTQARAANPKCDPVTFKGDTLQKVHKPYAYTVETWNYTDRQSLSAIIARIHEMTGPQVVCEPANSWGIPFGFMHNCIKCRFT